MGIQSFEEIESWKKGRLLVREIYKITNKPAFSKDFSLKDQIRRAGISVISNIAEGFERNSNRAFAQFLNIAKGSAGEIRAQLYVALDEGYISQNEFDSLSNLAIETSKLISGMIKYLKNREK